MITATHTHAVRTRPARRTGLLAWLLRLDAEYRQAQRMETLTPEARRDMGLPEDGAGSDRAILDRRFLTGQW